FATVRLRAAGSMAELRSTDLAFTVDEVEAVLRTEGLDLAPVDRQRLHELTSGWPVGVQLAVLAMRDSSDPELVIDALGESVREVSDYLANEVLRHLDPDLTEFMTAIGVLDEFDLELCQQITGREDSGQLLDRMLSDALFIADVAPGRYRFHAVFAAFLRARLRMLGPERFRAANTAAMVALRERGDLWGAVHHALVLDDVKAAGELLADSLVQALEMGDARQARDVARAWLSRFGSEVLTVDPRLLLEVLLVLTTFGVREAEQWLDEVDRAYPHPDPALASIANGAWADYFLNRGDAARALQHNLSARAAVAAAGDPSQLFPRLAELPLQEAGAHLLTGAVLGASAALRRPSPVAHPLVDEFRTPVLKSWVAFLEGDLAAARQVPERLRLAGDELDASPHGLGRIFANLLQAACDLERQELPAAAAFMTRALAASEVNGRPVIQSLVYRWQARVATAQYNHPAAAAALAQARMVLAEPDEATLGQLAVEEFRVLVAIQPEAAGPLVGRLPQTNESRLLQAKLLISRGARANAAQLLAAVEPATLREWVEWGVLSSLAASERDITRAHDYLRAALVLAEPHEYVATIVSQGTGIVSLLQAIPIGASLKPYVDLLSAAAESHGPDPRRTAGAMGDLSDRELTVLGLLSSRLTTAEMARTLFISPNTLKSHLKSIYRKLGVGSRADAVAEGEARGLL
ncbi:MAG: LuxR C-terminal-related transcriptional regulator, partial [Actinomycetes bacterium]